jgi:hypothetical protein
MASWRNPALGVVALMFFGTRLFAQTVPCSQLSVNLNLLRQGTTAPEPAASDVSAKLDKENVKVLSVRPGDPPHRVIVLLDSSGSVLSSPLAWHAYLAIARNIVTNLPNGTTAQVLVFADRVDMVVQVTDHVKLDGQFKALEPGWGYFQKPRSSALWDAMKTAFDMYGNPKQGDVLYLLSDGDDNSSRLRINDVETMFRSRPIELQWISIGVKGQPHKGTEALRRLQNLAIATGGSAAEISSKSQTESLLQAVPRPYRIDIDATPQLKIAERSNVTVTGATLEGTEIKYFGRPAACSATTTGNE